MELNGEAKEFLELGLVDGGRSLQKQGSLTPSMKLHLSPMETRHEKMLRILIQHAAALTSRVRELEQERSFTAHGDEHVLPAIGPYAPAPGKLKVDIRPGRLTPHEAVAHAYPGYRIESMEWDADAIRWHCVLVGEDPGTPPAPPPEVEPGEPQVEGPPIGPTEHIPEPPESAREAKLTAALDSQR